MFNFINFRSLTTTALLGILMAGNLIVPSSVSSQDNSPESVTLTGTLRDFSDQHPDFQRSPGETNSNGVEFRYGLDQGITTNNLGLDQKPVYAGGSYSTTTQENFDQWYRDIGNVNQSKEFAIELTKQSNGVYRYENTSFFPINDQLLGNEGRQHNYHFTYELHTRFTYEGGEVFNFSGDDDVFVYINGKKVIDIGGVHGRRDDSISLDDVANNIGLEIGQSYTLDFFFAERRTSQSNFIMETTLELETAPEVGGPNACVFDWSEVISSDPDGWVKDYGNNGDRDDLYRVYYHQPSGKYVKVSVAQRWNWGGYQGPGADSYPKSPKIVDHSRWGTGGFDGEDMFLFTVPTRDDELNSFTVEFFDDSELTQKAEVTDLNLTLTDLDGSSRGDEKIVVTAENAFGSAVPIEFYRPEGSVIEDSWINGGTVVSRKNNIRGPEGNIAPILLGDAHKFEVEYMWELAPGESNGGGDRHMYVSDMAWCGETVNVTPEEEVEIPDPEDPNNPNPNPDGDDFDKNGILDKNETDGDVDGNGIPDYQDPDDDGDGIADVMELYEVNQINLAEVNDVIYFDDNGYEVGTVSLPVAPVESLLPDEALNSYPSTKADYQNPDSDGDYIADQDEAGDTDITTPPVNNDNDEKPDYLDQDSDNDKISDRDEVEDEDLDTAPDDADGDNQPNYIDRDSDNDKIKDRHEAGDSRLDTPPRNTDQNLVGGDDIPDFLDDDSDADGFSDRIEAGDDKLSTPPVNSDNINDQDVIGRDDLGFPAYDDQTPDFIDLDSDDNGILDIDEIHGSIDNDQIDNYRDLDDDGDGIADVIEIGADPANPTNSDNDANDGEDYQDTNSDNDPWPDSVEGVSSGDGTTPITVTAPDGTATTVNLKNNSETDLVDSVSIQSGDNGTVTITGTPLGYDYQTGTFAD